MSKPESTKIGTGEVHFTFAEPKDPSDVQVRWQLPYNARVTSVVVRYVQIPHEVVLAERKAKCDSQKRHDAAVKANATRKAKKEAQQP